MLLPGIIACFTPLIVGLLIGARCLAGLLIGSIATGFLLAVMMNNAGGAWDNSKKYVENDSPALGDWKNDPIHGRVTKATTWHEAVVVGDTVGDPFKDTSGPALNILIKLMSMISLTIAPILKDVTTTPTGFGVTTTEKWENWYWGMIPLGVSLIITVLVCMRDGGQGSPLATVKYKDDSELKPPEPQPEEAA